MLALRPFASSGTAQHIQIRQHGRQMVRFGLQHLGYDSIDHSQPRAAFQRAVTGLQSSRATFVVPVMDDALQYDASAPAGTDSKKLPPMNSALSATPAAVRFLFAPSAQCGRSKTMRRIDGYFVRIALISSPNPPPTFGSLATMSSEILRAAASAARRRGKFSLAHIESQRTAAGDLDHRTLGRLSPASAPVQCTPLRTSVKRGFGLEAAVCASRWSGGLRRSSRWRPLRRWWSEWPRYHSFLPRLRGPRTARLGTDNSCWR